MGRLRRQHRLQPEGARRRAGRHGDAGRRRRAVSRAARGARHRQRRRAQRARDVHRAGVHHHRPRRQPDHRVSPRRDERVARESRRRRRRHRARHRRAGRPRRHARARRAVRERRDPVRVRSGPGAAAVLGAGADRDDRRGDVRRRQRLRGAAARGAHRAPARGDRPARRGADRDAGRRRLAHTRGRPRARDAGGHADGARRPDRLRRRLPGGTAVRHRQRLDWERTGRLAAMLGSLKIGSRGGQNHAVDRDAIATLFYEHFRDYLW